MTKPKGGRGYKAPYETHQIRVPDPIAPQVHSLIERYQDYIAASGDAVHPPQLLDTSNKKTEASIRKLERSLVKLKSRKAEAIKILSDALGLKANAGGAIKQEIKKALEELAD